MWGTIWVLLPMLWRWWTTLEYEMQSSTDNHWMLFIRFAYGLEHGLGIHIFWPTWPCQSSCKPTKILQPSGYCIVLNSVFTFCSTNVFSCFCGVIAQFKTISSQVRQCYTPMCVAFKSQREREIDRERERERERER